MRDCAHKQSMCTCIDWKNDDLTMQVNHLMNHFDFTDFELKYITLEPEENRCLCKVGRCRICHKDLCIGKELPSQAKSDELLTEVYRWMFQMWNPSHDRLTDGGNQFPVDQTHPEKARGKSTNRATGKKAATVITLNLWREML